MIMNHTRQPLNRLTMKMQRPLHILHPATLQVRTGQCIDGILNGLAGACQRQYQLRERVARLLAEHNQVAELVAEVGDEFAPVLPVRELGEGGDVKVEQRRAHGARRDHGEVWRPRDVRYDDGLAGAGLCAVALGAVGVVVLVFVEVDGEVVVWDCGRGQGAAGHAWGQGCVEGCV